MSSVVLSAKLDRADLSTPWGFRMHGGKDYGTPLTIQRVTPGSLAHKCDLQVGDSILRIGGDSTDFMAHKDAEARIRGAGNFLEITLQRSSGGYAPAQAPAPAPSYQPAPYQPAPAPYTPASTYGQDFNRAPQPFSPGGSAPGVCTAMPGHVLDNLSGQVGGMNIGGPPAGPGPSPPWASAGGGGGGGPAAAPAHAPAPSGGDTVYGAWQPRVPTGPRKMKLGRAGEARSMAAQTSGRIPICDSCGISIRGPFVLALEKTWCPEHFNCSNPQCGIKLIGVGFVEEEGQLFCEKDFEKYLAPRCGKCGNAIVHDCVNALKDTFHPDCFVCVTCGTGVGQGSFHMEDGKIYCEKDWQAMFQTKCYGCQFPIESGDRWVEALNQNWHSECFNCSTCQVNLEGQPFFAKGDRPFCKKHASTKRF